MGVVVAAGLYKEVKTRAGPEVMKQIQAKVDLGLLMYNEYYTKAMTAAAPVLPVLKQAKTQATELYSKAVAAATPKLAQLNAYLQRAKVEKKTFAGKSQAANGNAKNPTAPKKKA